MILISAGTGHAALCELNYTPEQPDGSIDICKAVHINEQFQLSRQFWERLVEQSDLQHPEAFIRPLPHLSFVSGEDQVSFSAEAV